MRRRQHSTRCREKREGGSVASPRASATSNLLTTEGRTTSLANLSRKTLPTAYSEDEQVVFGWGDFERLGHGNPSYVFTPQPVKALHRGSSTLEVELVTKMDSLSWN